MLLKIEVSATDYGRYCEIQFSWDISIEIDSNICLCVFTSITFTHESKVQSLVAMVIKM